MEKESQTIFDKNVIEFVTVAAEFCAFLERAERMKRSTFVDTSLKILPLLYLKASMLPKCETIGDEAPETYVTEEIYEILRINLSGLMGDKDDYLDVFVQDMVYSDQPIKKNISEDLADIYQAIKDFIFVFQLGLNETMNDSLAICQEQFKEYFRTAPLWVMDSFHIEEMDKGVIFVRENAPVENIYFIGKGIIEAIDYRVHGVAYEFMRFDNVYAMGGMEYIMDMKTYRTTLRTVTRCTVVKMSRANFEKWMSADIHALKQEAKQVANYLLEEGRKGRTLLFLQGADRLSMLLVERFERYAKNGLLQVRGGQQGLSNCLKTINRSVKKLSEQGLITKEGNKILVDQSQYERLKEIISKIVTLE